MLTFRKGYAGILVLLRFRGTAWPYGILPGLISASIGLVLSFQTEANDVIATDDEFLVNHYPFQLFAYLVGFFMVFRTNFTYRRYWLALEAVQIMGARWLAGACLAIAADSPGAADASQPFLAQSALRQLQKDEAPEGKEEGGPLHPGFFTEVAHLFSLLHALALQHLRMEPVLSHLEDSSWEDGEWLRLFDAASALSPGEHCGNYGGPEHCEDMKAKMALKVLGKLSRDEMRLLSMDGAGHTLPGDVRVSMVISWIIRRFVARQKHEPKGDMSKTSPPILSRLFALVSDGALAFSQAKKIAEVPFPFPYQNLKETVLWIYVATVPIVVNAKTNHIAFRFIVNFMVVWAYFALSKVGDTLEDPFDPHDPNDLPLTSIHHSFNVQLLSYGMVPRTAADIVTAAPTNANDSASVGGPPAQPQVGPVQIPSGSAPPQLIDKQLPAEQVLEAPREGGDAALPVCSPALHDEPTSRHPSDSERSVPLACGCWWLGIPCQ